ncbi:MAG: very short patch repair endonuclease [Prosthecobacter sp.]|jgi:DNA mismatch endonuclease (patch repair protein)|uniref:very short patch repair endonuclease n=1 Tax=Prosthecobacter sp. TaxID=1965333 RepID=UPI0019FDD1D2|nr:very short patch repair endonuclease [Prosthecobacter sp.]MBE2286069.1 very short patch repair endonuclease [Prosthecobacter sp.]
MPDVFTPAKRSEVMSRIRSRGNKDTELRLRAIFREQGITGWRRHVAIRFQVSGAKFQDGPRKPKRGVTNLKSDTWNLKRQTKSVRPDFMFRRERVVVFVNGCFWHGCPDHYRRPKGNRKFWDAKIARNIARDAEVSKALRKAGWRVLHLWEHELAKKREPRLLARLRRWLGER